MNNDDYHCQLFLISLYGLKDNHILYELKLNLKARIYFIILCSVQILYKMNIISYETYSLIVTTVI